MRLDGIAFSTKHSLAMQLFGFSPLLDDLVGLVFLHIYFHMQLHSHLNETLYRNTTSSLAHAVPTSGAKIALW
jgi:hypothetical protein